MLQIPASGQEPLARDNYVIAFFLPDPFPGVAEAVLAAFNLWRSVVPAAALGWRLVGATAEEAKPIGAKTIAQCVSMLDPAKAAKREITAFSLFGPQSNTPDHRFNVVGERMVGSGFTANLVGLIEIWIPNDFQTASVVADFARRLAEFLPYLSGYAAPALAFSPAVDVHAAGRAIRGLAFRHPGYDVPRNETTRFYIGKQSIGARWLTFLGPQLIEQLGGPNALANAVPGISLKPAGAGLMLQAGIEPEIGDVNRRVETPLLRVLARALEPVTLFGNRGLEPVFGDADALDRWERRLLN